MNLTYCGRAFSPAELELIATLAATAKSREALARALCAELGWKKPDGGLKTMSAKVALLRMQRDALIQLPAPWHASGRAPRGRSPASQIGLPITGSRADLADLHLAPIATREQSHLWNEIMRQHHYLGYQPLPGAQIRYLIRGGGHLLGGLGFGAAAWKIAPRDRFIGWTPAQREAHLPLVVDLHRFLVLPWVRVPCLASHLLGRLARRLPADWAARYATPIALLETFVEADRFAGTCYAAANWRRVGQTQGRGRMDRAGHGGQPIKHIWLYPLVPNFREVLTDNGHPPEEGRSAASRMRAGRTVQK